MTRAGRLLLWRADVMSQPDGGMPGTLVAAGPGITAIATGRDLLRPREVQPENRKAMPWEDFLRGARLGPGARVTWIGT